MAVMFIFGATQVVVLSQGEPKITLLRDVVVPDVPLEGVDEVLYALAS
jgi:hypothetical protein